MTQTVLSARVRTAARAGRGRRRNPAATVVAVLVLLAVWQLIGVLHLLGGSIPSATEVVTTVAAQWPLLSSALLSTGVLAILGALIGVAVGLCLAMLGAWFPRTETVILRATVVINAIPVVALGPVLMTVPSARPAIPVVFGALAALFSTVITVSDGFRSAPTASSDIFRVFGSSRSSRFLHLQLPTSVPLIADAIRLAIPAAILGTLLGEWFGADNGLGVIMISAMHNVQYGLLWSAALVAVLFSMVLYFAATLLERWATRVFGRSTNRPAEPARLPRRVIALVAAVLVIAVLALWQFWIMFGQVPLIVAPAPADVAGALVGQFGEFAAGAGLTSLSAIGGLIAGSLVGFLLAVLLWLAPTLSTALAPLAVLIPTIPIVVFIPILGSLFGYGIVTIFVACIVMAFFPVYVLVASGLETRPPGSDDIFAVYGARRITTLVRLAIPAAFPSLMLAVRLSAANCFLIALSAEWLMGQGGLGRIFSERTVALDTAGSWAAVVVAVALSLVVYGLCVVLERAVDKRWR